MVLDIPIQILYSIDRLKTGGKMSKKAKQKMISIYPVDEATLHQIGKDEGLATFSATLRWLINDWQRMKAQQAEVLAAYHRARYVTEKPR